MNCSDEWTPAIERELAKINHATEDESTFSIYEIPTDEREAYLLNLPPERLRWALFDACENLSLNTPKNSHSETLLFWLMQACGSFGLLAAGKDLQTVRQNAALDVGFLVPAIVESLNRLEQRR